ncbi:hypothetical protein HPB48_007285 [Haemaphysalis longicornis]|uniref:Uncharacterized protein n=1 Tax=Haemaphysalis longicornis TaxID=44386 RepID=A0A9J6FM69_HAELO|nr:hypothetical protein HPB48_007285 [Haemaphysalis longicornis]
MTSDVDLCRSRSSPLTQVGAEVRQVRQQSWAVVNLLVTVGGTFAFFYKAVEYSLPDPHIALQVLAALFASIVVACGRTVLPHTCHLVLRVVFHHPCYEGQVLS